ncbi:MAG: acyl-CoA synthetase, partial [Alphaproteobacteria bacterium]|nr:acyl-CoA synthetase [Alphaproteobacteria bacterium]
MTEQVVRIRTLQDIEEFEKTPLEKRFSERSTYEIIKNAAAKNGDKTAISFLPTGSVNDVPVEVTFNTLFARTNQTANLLNDLGVGDDASVSFLLPNLPETHFLIWGGEAAGIVNPINPLLEPHQIADIMIAANSKVLVALGPLPGTEIWSKAEAVKDMVPCLETVIQVLGPGDESKGILSYDKVIDKYPSDKLTSGREIKPDDIAAYFHTGGTTGAPKLAQHTHFGEVFEAWAMGHMMGTTSTDALICGLPLFHVNAVIVTGLAPFMFGASVVIPSPAGYRTPVVIQEFWKITERYKATFFSAVPTIYSALLNVPIGDTDVSSLRNAICGAAPMPVEVIKAFEETSGVKIQEGYGLTEGTCASCVNPSHGERRTGSIGFRFPYQEMKAVKVDNNGDYLADCGIDEVGVISISGPNVFPGYKQEKHNQGIWVKEGWLNTGDLGRVDADGYFWLTGRAKDLIIRGGHNIDPAH